MKHLSRNLLTSILIWRTMMTKRSHNKKRNVGIIYEQLLATIAQGMVENNSKKTSAAQKIIKKYFREGTELYKEHRLFKALVEPHISDGSLATKILDEAKKAARGHHTTRLTREKNKLIREININFGKGFYNTKVNDYTNYATVQTLLNDWRSYSKADIARVTLYEQKAHSILTSPKEDTPINELKDQDVDNLVVNVMTKKFNEKYGKQLTETQQLLVREYVFAENGDTTGFRNMLESIKKKVLSDLVNYEVSCDNTHVSNKINEVKEDIRSLDINTLDDQTMTRFLTLCDLSEELRRK